MAQRRSSKTTTATRSNTEIRNLILRYFYDRNRNATSARGKKGFAIKIMDIRKELKTAHDLSQQEVMGNLNYLISQGWIAEETIEKSVPLRSGTVVPQTTSFYSITAAGIDKIEGPGEFTMDKFTGIKIEATGQNIITVGEGNRVNARYGDIAEALEDLRKEFIQSEGPTETDKLDSVADIASIESQLVKTTPNRTIISGAWENVKRFDTVLGIADKISKVAVLLKPFIT
jgi:hypothetical protein